MLLVDLALVGAAAALAGWTCRRLGVPEMLGYILAGVLLGPNTPPFSFIRDVDAVRALAAFAVVFRMFSLGLEFDARRLEGRWKVALLAGAFEILACAAAGALLGQLAGFTRLEGAVLGAALGTTSTNVLMRALADRGLLARPEARNAAAITIVEDLLAMALLAVLALGRSGAPGPELARDAFELLLFALAAFTAGSLAAPRVLDRLARDFAEDLLVIAVVAVMFLLAGITTSLDAGPAVGAFLGGVVVGGARHAPGVVDRVMPLRDLFTAVFFVSAGMLLDPRLILAVAPVALLVPLAFVPLKAAAVALGARLGGADGVLSARTGATLAQTGTLGIVVAAGAFLPPERASLLFAFAFVSWAVTVALTRPRLERAPDALERILLRCGARRRPHEQGPPARRRAPLSRHALLALTSFGGAVGFVLVAHHALRRVGGAPEAFPLVLATALAAGLATAPFLALCAGACRDAAGVPARAWRLSPAGILRGGKLARASLLVAGAARLPTLAVVAVKLYVLPLDPPGASLAFAGGILLGDLVLLANPRARDAVLGRLGALLARAPRPLDPPELGGVGPYGVDTEVVRVPRGSPWVGRRVGELPLPPEGARLIAVVRSDRLDPRPFHPSLELRAGDGLVLLGTPRRLLDARRHLLHPDAPEPRSPTP